MGPEEIDSLIAERIMGVLMPSYSEHPSPVSSRLTHPSKCWYWTWAGGGYPDHGKWCPIPFSTIPSASKQLRDRLRELGFDYSLGLTTDLATQEKHYGCLLDNGKELWNATADTEEMAVALASLKTLEVKT